MALTKAKIEILGTPKETLTCLFNPTDYTVARTVSWETVKTKENPIPKMTFGSIGKTTLTLKLLFDTTLDAGKKDVRTTYTDKLWKAARIANPEDPKEPPHVLFTWGSTWSFESVITSISQTFTLFKEDGTPIRSEVTLSLDQIKDTGTFAKQNPTSHGTPGKIHQVQEGDRLDLLAQQYYSQPFSWKRIAEFNNIDNPRSIVPGQYLLIPPIS
ncbi:MAG: LysM peptidoglycan-binding domain-containing protein [Chloroflexota bacterium]|nr:LysM peptidoglycan-binding domain-containing protein [Chloroflexota bacterium]